MIEMHIDLGQIILGTLITIVGWFVKREIMRTSIKLDKHELIIQKLVGDIQFVIGHLRLPRRGFDDEFTG